MFFRKKNKNQLSKREIKLLDKNTCPDCKSKNSLYKTPETNNAFTLSCKECNSKFIVIEQIITSNSVEFKNIHNQDSLTKIIERI